MPTAKIKILLADDHLIVRMGLRTILSIEDDFFVCGEAASGTEAIREALRLKPDVVLMDLMMPKMNGVEATAEIVKNAPTTHVLILTTYATSDLLRSAFDAGASGALVKDSSRSLLAKAIRETAAGRRFISPDIQSGLDAPTGSIAFSDRQLKILRLVAKGFNNKEIAEFVGISRDTVKASLKTIFARLGAASRAEAVALAIRERLLKP